MRVGSVHKLSSPTSCFPLEFFVCFILGHVQKQLPLWHKSDIGTPSEVLLWTDSIKVAIFDLTFCWLQSYILLKIMRVLLIFSTSFKKYEDLSPENNFDNCVTQTHQL